MDTDPFGAPRTSSTPEAVPHSGRQGYERPVTEHPDSLQDAQDNGSLTTPDVVPVGLAPETTTPEGKKPKSGRGLKTVGIVGGFAATLAAGAGLAGAFGGPNNDVPEREPTATSDTLDEPAESVDEFQPSEEVEGFMTAYATKYNFNADASVDEQFNPTYSDAEEEFATSVFNAEQAYIQSHNGAGIIIGDEAAYKQEYPSSEVLQLGETSPLGFTAAKWENGKEPNTENFIDFLNNQTIPNYESLANALIKNPSAADQIRTEFINYPGLGKEGSGVIVDTMVTIASNYGPDTNLTFNAVSPDSTTPIEENSHIDGGVGIDAVDEDGKPTKASAPVTFSVIATTFDADGNTTSDVQEVFIDTGVDYDPGFNPFGETTEQRYVGLYAQ